VASVTKLCYSSSNKVKRQLSGCDQLPCFNAWNNVHWNYVTPTIVFCNKK